MLSGIYLFQEANSLRSRKTVSFEEQIMSFIILQIFYAMCAVLKFGVYLTIGPLQLGSRDPNSPQNILYYGL